MLGSRLDVDASFALLDAYAEAGGTMVDTAAVYSDWLPDDRGRLQRADDRALAAGPTVRPRCWWPPRAATRTWPAPTQPRLDGPSLRHDVEQSLERLGLAALRLWLTHRDDPSPAGRPRSSVPSRRSGPKVCCAGTACPTGRTARVAEVGPAAGRRCTLQGSSRPRPPSPRPHPRRRPDGRRPGGRRRARCSPRTGTPSSRCSPTRPRPRAGSPAPRGRRPPTTRRPTDECGTSCGPVAAEVGAEPGQVALAALLGLDAPVRLVVGCSSVARWRTSLAALNLTLTVQQQSLIQSALPASLRTDA